MNIFQIRRLAILLAALLIALPPAFAQKKTTPAGGTKAEQRYAPGSEIRELLGGLLGQQTNLGVLAKVTAEYVEFHAEGDTLMYPLATLQVVKFLKAEEGEGRKIEIRFLARD